MIEVKWFARGGQGGFTASRVFGLSAVLHSGKYAQAFPSFGPERRGAPVYGFTRISDTPVQDHSQVYSSDYSIVIDNTLMDTVDVTKGLKQDGVLFVNTAQKREELGLEKDVKVVTFDASVPARRVLGKTIANTAMMAVAAAWTGLADLDSMLEAIRISLPSGLAEQNIELVTEVYNLACAERKTI